MDWNELFLSNIKDTHVKAILSMFHTSYRHNKLLEKELQPYDISHEQFNVLKILRKQAPNHFGLKEIQLRLFNQTANTTRLVDKLKKKELVESVINPDNRRQLNIKITEKGLRVLGELEEPMSMVLKEIKSVITEEEANSLISIMTKIQQLDEASSK